MQGEHPTNPPASSSSSSSSSPATSASGQGGGRFQSHLLLTDDEIRALGVPEHNLELFRRQRYQAAFGIESWYGDTSGDDEGKEDYGNEISIDRDVTATGDAKLPLSAYTFYTRSLELSYVEGKALVDYHLHKYSSREEKKWTEDQEGLLHNLERRIDEVLTRGGKRFEEGAFIKLNTRSPKDVTVYDYENEHIAGLVRREFDELYKDVLLDVGLEENDEDDSEDNEETEKGGKGEGKKEDEEKQKQKEKNSEGVAANRGAHPLIGARAELKSGAKLVRDGNAETNAFVVATNKALRIGSGKDALYLLTRSDRICEDLSKLMPYGEMLFSAKLVIRQWLDEVAVRPQYEFRAFVHQNKLNALSQYYCFCKYDDLIARKAEVQKIILDFFDSVKSSITHGSYVIDFYVRSDNGVMIIELNPFHNGAGGCLFNWRDDRTRFMNGPFEFRITETLKEDPRNIIPNAWLKLINAYLEGPPQETKLQEPQQQRDSPKEEQSKCVLS